MAVSSMQISNTRDTSEHVAYLKLTQQEPLKFCTMKNNFVRKMRHIYASETKILNTREVNYEMRIFT